jgi:transcription elongation factor GreA
LDTKDEWVYTIVGSFEADPAEDRISNESPVGDALMEKKVGDRLSVDTPAGEMHLKIVKITK